ncbi:MAG: CpaF family protein [Chloroflexi bacterium]|nr:CpaF family protein [Chloroflexota bacterium]MDA1147351.1 CpaF family protein [Chloroflexota bacterium]
MGMGRIGWRRSDEGSVADPWSDLPERRVEATAAAEGDVLTEDREIPRASTIVLEPSDVAAPRMENAPMVIEAEGPVIDQAAPPTRAELAALRARLHRSLISDFDHRGLAELPIAEARPIVIAMARQLVESDVPANFSGSRIQLLNELVDDIIGLGPIEPLLRDNTVSEIMVNGCSRVYVERFGRIEMTDVQFRDDAHVMQVLDRMLANVGRTIDFSQPMVDARLPDGSRVNAIVPPASIDGPMITIRKFVADRLTSRDLIAMGSLNQEAASLLEAAVVGGAGIVVSGGTGSGKTTMLNVLSEWVPSDERIVTIEDPAELSLRQPHVVALEARDDNSGFDITRAQLLKNALRMRPDRILIGEVRGAEAFDMLQAMNTGHDGSMTTVHANAPRDALRRIEQMVMMAGYDWPLRAIREQVSSAVDIIIQVARMRDGSRRIVDITEVHGMEGDTLTMQQLYYFEQRGVDEDGRIVGGLVSTGLRPRTFDMPGAQSYEAPFHALRAVDEPNDN